MSLDTVITSSLLPQPERRSPAALTALVLMGGGARTAYQAGVLRALAPMLKRQPWFDASQFPFQTLVGTSAGALNVTFLASKADDGLLALSALADFWHTLRSHQVYRLDAPAWVRISRLLAGWALSRQVRNHRALLDNTPLVDTLHQSIDLTRLERKLARNALDSVAITASSYTTGVHWTFCQVSPGHSGQVWGRPDRRADMQPITIEHLMASAAIPFLFRAVPLWVHGQRDLWRRSRARPPLSPAIHLGARKTLAIGVGQPQRAGMVHQKGDEPTAGTDRGTRHGQRVQRHPAHRCGANPACHTHAQATATAGGGCPAPYQPVEVLAIQPSSSLDALALTHVNTRRPPRGTCWWAWAH